MITACRVPCCLLSCTTVSTSSSCSLFIKVFICLEPQLHHRRTKMRRNRLARNCIQRVWKRAKLSLRLGRPDSETMAAPHVIPAQITKSETPAPVPVPEKSQTKKFDNNALESLPAEIRRLLLSTLEYDELKALVHASPVYHQQYLLDRQPLLCNCLETTLGSNTIVDAWAVYQSGFVDFSETRTTEIVTQFLEPYQNQHSSSSRPSLLNMLTLDEVISMVTFHTSVIKPLLQDYTGWALDTLTEQTKNPQSHQPLSRTEETRLVRGMYHFQLYCNLFGSSYACPWFFRVRGIEILRIFMSIYEPWEVEEMLCINAFAKEKLNKVFNDIHWDVHEENPRFEEQHRPPTPDGAFDFDNSWSRSDLLEGTISRGLKLLHYVLFKIKDHEHLVSTMQNQITPGKSHSLGYVLDGATQAMWHRLYPSSKTLRHKQRDPFPFQGDSEDLPPLAWTLIWKGAYSILFGEYLNCDFRFWGYIMWDAARIHTGAEEVLARQWEARWKGADPRDRFSWGFP